MDSWVRKFPWRRDRLPTPVFLSSPGGLDGKESSCNVGELGSIPELGRSPGGGHNNPLQYSCLENPHGQRNLAGYSPWGRKELDTTERLSTAQLWRTVWQFLKKQGYHTTQPSYSWEYTLRKPQFRKMHTSQCSLLHYYNSQDMEAT